MTCKARVAYELDLTFTAAGGTVSYQVTGGTAAKPQGLKEKIRITNMARFSSLYADLFASLLAVYLLVATSWAQQPTKE